MSKRIKTPSWWVRTSNVEKMIVAFTLFVLAYLIIRAL
jgi:hypothetical protein